MREQWQFRFFDVSQVKLPDDESSFLSEVRRYILRAHTLSHKHHRSGTSRA
jgi:hypothetical protein